MGAVAEPIRREDDDGVALPPSTCGSVARDAVMDWTTCR